MVGYVIIYASFHSFALESSYTTSSIPYYDLSRLIGAYRFAQTDHVVLSALVQFLERSRNVELDDLISTFSLTLGMKGTLLMFQR